MEKEKIKISPDAFTYNSEDSQKLIIEVTLPGVDKNDINLMMLDDSLTLSAPRDELEYSLALSLCCPVKAKDARADYKNELLRIEVPYKDYMDNAVRIKIA